MKIQVNTDSSIEGRDEMARRAEAVVAKTLRHLSEHVTRVEVHLSDVNRAKGGTRDKRCVMEARLEGQRPTAVTEEASTIDQAVEGAAGKLERSLSRAIGKSRGW